ncbi:MAG TPA: hypothetical protein QKA08_02255 [Candidatus Megaira endosymbiont of Nemacystus decipiens]|nr:hypothetical protein [Candidatus Megaera endosymbiont of Nemacystus decipiens]
MAKGNDNDNKPIENPVLDNQPEQTLSDKINALDDLVKPALGQIQEQIDSGNVDKDQKEDLKILGGVLLQTRDYIQALNKIPNLDGVLNDTLGQKYLDLVNSCNAYKDEFNVGGVDFKAEIDNLTKFRNNDYTESLQKTAQDLYNVYASVVSLDQFAEVQKQKAQGMLDKLGKSFDIKEAEKVIINTENAQNYLTDDFLNQVEDLCKSNDELKKAKSAEQRYLLTKAILGTATVLHETTKAFGKTGFELTKNLAGLIEDCINYTLVQFAINPAKAFAKDLYSGVKGGIDMTLAKEEYAHWKGDGKTAAAKAGKIAQLVVANFIPVAIGGGVGAAAGTVTGTAKATWGATKGLAYAPVASFKDIKEKAVAIKNEGVSSVKTAVKDIKARTNYAENIRKEKSKKKFNENEAQNIR